MPTTAAESTVSICTQMQQSQPQQCRRLLSTTSGRAMSAAPPFPSTWTVAACALRCTGTSAGRSKRSSAPTPAPHLYASDCLRSGNNYLESQNSSNLAITQLDIETNGRYAPFASCVPDEFGRNYACARNGSAVGTMNLTAVTVQATMGG